MVINKKIITFETKALFIGDKGINTTNLITTPDKNGNVHNIPYHSVVFIKDTQEIWSSGTYFYGFKAFISPINTHISTNWPTNTNNNAAMYKLSGTDGYLGNSLGSYLLQIDHPTDQDGGIYTGYFSYTLGSGTDEEIILHRSGNSSTKRLFAKIKYIIDGIYLLLSSTEDEANCTELIIKIKKLI